MTGLSDEAVVRRIREEDGDSALSWAELTRRYYAPAWHFARGRLSDGNLAQDVVQAAFLRVIRALHQFDANRSFASWFYTILRNLCTDVSREQHRQRKLLAKLALAQSVAGSPPVTKDPADLGDLLAALSPDDREALICRHLHGMTAGEAAAVLGISPEAAKKRGQRALDKLRGKLSQTESANRRIRSCPEG